VPSLKDIRKRIGSVKNTQKITRAMKLVAAAKLRRAQDQIVAARPYAESIDKVVAELAARAGEEAHELLADRPMRKAEILFLTSDRGLAGSFNAQIIRKVESFVAEELSELDEVSLRVVGRKGNDYFKRRNANIRGYVPAPAGTAALDTARDLSNHVVEDFLEGAVDRVYLVYNEFKSAMTQHVVIKQILPIAAGASDEHEDETADDFIYEPGKKQLLEHLLPQYIQTGIYRAHLESIASEFGARMSAMDSATRNAGEMIDKLTLQFNRARQASITKELLEIIAGAEALNG
jgi:F-type H+-transporting ATPase subunit gamma